MSFTVLQVILITLLAFIKHIDYYGIPMLFVNYPVFWGLFTGIIVGDVNTGLVVGGTVQLMALGVSGFGGSSVPDYGTTTIIATAIGTKMGIEAGLALGIPVGMLGVQFDVIVKILNGFVVKKSQEYANKKEFKKMNLVLWICPILFGLSAAIPVFISLTLGTTAVNFLLNNMPTWFISGLTLAGNMLPAVGIAMLLRFMPLKQYINYFLIGFVISAFLKMPVIGVAIVGFALAFDLYKRREHEASLNISGGGDNEDE